MRIAAAVAVFVSVAVVSGAPQQSLSVAASLDRYSAGAHAEAVDRLQGGLNVAALLDQLEQWTKAGDIDGAVLARRRVIAAAFALDVVAVRATVRPMVFYQSFASHDMLGQPVRGRPWPPAIADPGAALSLVAWGCQWMSASRTTSPAERAWWLLSVALLEDGSEWLTLLGTDHTGRTLPGGEVTRREIADGHLKHARLRLPGDPRWELADVRARMQDLVGLQVAAATGPAARGLFFDGRFDVLRHAEQAVRGVNTGRLNDLERDLRRLVEVDAVSADAGVQLGYLRLLRREWKDALTHFDRAAARTRDTFLTTAIDYFRGWIFERTDRPADAIAAYQRAYANAPGDQNLSSLLAAQLFLVNRRQEAAEILDAIWRTPVPSDLVLQFEGGDARFAGEYVRQMREALR